VGGQARTTIRARKEEGEAMTCSDCKGTGKIVLLTSVVDCGCKVVEVLAVPAPQSFAAALDRMVDEIAKASRCPRWLLLGEDGIGTRRSLYPRA
jgi:hypothetical protein